MPELPEVETIRRELDQRIKGLTVENIEVRAPKMVSGDIKNVIGAKITNVGRRAKILLIDLDNNFSLVIHLKLTGQLVYMTDKELVAGGHPVPPTNQPLPNQTTRVIFDFNNGAKLFFNDLRKFGWIKIMPIAEIPKIFYGKFGPEPFKSDFTYQWYSDLLARKTTKIKQLLMDQESISGIGNIYSDEALWCARIHPLRKAKSLLETERKKLFDCISRVLALALEKGGASENAYVNALGEKGDYMKVASVYRQEGKKCSRDDGGIIKRLKIGGRSAHFCPVCQK